MASARFKLIILLPLLFLVGCWDAHPLEKLNLYLVFGFDKAKEKGKIVLSSTSPVLEKRAKQKVMTISTVGDSYLTAQTFMDKRGGKLGVHGQVQAVLVSSDLSKERFTPLLDSFQRDPILPSTSLLGVVKGNVSELMQLATKFPDKPFLGSYVSDLISMGELKGLTSKATLNDFWRNYYDEGVDNVLPYLTYTKKELNLAGVAVFRDEEDRVVGFLNSQEALLYLIMAGKSQKGVLEYTVPYKKDRVSIHLSVQQVSTKIRVQEQNGKLAVSINPKVKGNMMEIKAKPGISINKKEISTLEKELSKNLDQSCMNFFQKTQGKYKADVIGIGRYVRAYLPTYWKKGNWDEEFPKANILVKSDIQINSIGIIQ